MVLADSATAGVCSGKPQGAAVSGITSHCGVCRSEVRADSASRILRHPLPNATVECLGAHPLVDEWASEDERLTVEGQNPPSRQEADT
jgi:hypothetical protein